MKKVYSVLFVQLLSFAVAYSQSIDKTCKSTAQSLTEKQKSLVRLGLMI